MRNRAKCKKCASILESFHRYDYVTCKCGEISISGGLDKLEVYYNAIENFMRIDDDGNTILVQENQKDASQDKEANQEKHQEISKKDKIAMLDAVIKNLENLPQNAMSLPITHYDFYSFALVVSSILRED